jgi:tetratricopeptide (TPR) repeat protein
MTKDELLAGFLDRSLSEDQLLEFQAIRSNDPAFAGEVDKMLTLEKVLVHAAPVIVPPADFLVSVESTVAAKVAAGASGKVLSGLLSSAWTWVTAGTVAVVGAGAIILTDPASDAADPATPVVTEQVGAAAEMPIQQTITSPTVEPSTSPLSIVTERPTPSVVPPAANPVRNNDVVASNRAHRSSSNVDITADGREQSTLAKVIEDLSACEQRGDHMSCAQLAIQIGRVYRDQGDIAESMSYLNKALRHAQQSRIATHEIEAFGELTSMKAGNTTEARQYLTSAVELGEQAKVDVSKWETRLNALR